MGQTAGMTVTTADPRELLEALLVAADIDQVRGRAAREMNARRRAAAEKRTPRGEAYSDAFTRELEAARPILEALVSRVRALARLALIRGADREREAARIALDWNRAIREGKWTTLPPLCVRCGRPVLVRGWSSDGLAETCTKACGDAVRDAKKKAAKRRREPPAFPSRSKVKKHKAT